MKTAYKFLRTGLKSNYDKSEWKLGEWRIETKPIKECEGLNCSKYIPDAMGCVQGEILAKVEYGGTVIDSGDKLTCQKMRVVQTWDWAKEDSVKIAIFAARLVLPIFEKQYPADYRPRKAIEAAELCLNSPTENHTYAATYAATYAINAATYAADRAANAAQRSIKNKIQKHILSMLKHK